MAHRGPDGEGVWSRRAAAAPFVSLGHRRLAIIDLSDSALQPMASPDGRVHITFNGEIYNYRELMQELIGLGQTFRSHSDTEVLLQAYCQWGTACLERLNGMFAFAIWDERTRELFAARDRFGEKPFHYHVDASGRTFAFASEIKALVAAGVVTWTIDDEALRQYIDEGVLDGGEQTIYRGVKRLPPASAMRLRMTGDRFDVKVWQYWSLPRPVRLIGDAREAAERFRELFEDSVRLRLRSDVPVGTSLSGGLDSSAVVCTIRQLGAAGGQKTFTARMSDPKLDEGKYMTAVLEATGVEGHEVTPAAEDLRGLFERMCFHMEEPFPATSMFAQFLVMRLAREQGVTVLLDGQGADELLGGYHGYFRLRYGDLMRAGRMGELRRELGAYAGLRDGMKVMSWKGLATTLLPAGMIDRRRSSATRRFEAWWDESWLRSSPLTAGSENGNGRYFDRFDAGLRHDSMGGPLQSLLRYGDRNSMAWSRELRQPFLDHRLAELVFSIAPELKISDGMTKVVLRQAMRGIVPDVILDRQDKLGYQAPQGRWLSESLRSWTEERLESAAAVLDGRLGRGIVDRFRALRHPLDEWHDGRDVFRLLTLGECLRQVQAARDDSGTAAEPDAPSLVSVN